MPPREDDTSLALRLERLATGVAASLGARWRFETPEHGNTRARRLWCTVPDGKPYVIHFYKRWNQDMVDWSGEYVRIEGGYGPKNPPKIGTSVDGDYAAIARRIRRKLLAPYEVARAEAFQIAAEVTARRDAMAAQAAGVAAIFGAEVREHGARENILIYPQGGGKIEILAPDRVTMSFEFSYEQACKMSQLIHSLA